MVQVGYRLTIGGQPAPAELLETLQRVEVEEHASMASLLRLTFAVAIEESGAGWTVVDEDYFPRLGDVALAIAVGNAEPEPVLTGHVIETRAVLSDSPQRSTLDVVAMDASVLMNLEEKVRPWPNMSDSDIAESIFGDYGLTAVIDRAEPTRQEDDVIPVQRGTDIQFLRYLAERNGFDLFVAAVAAGAEGHFHAPRLDEEPQGVLTVGFGGASNVPELTVTFDALRPTTASAAQIGADGSGAESATAEEVSLPELGGDSFLGAGQRRVTLMAGTGVTGTAELQTYVQAVVDRSSWAVRAEGEVNTSRYGSVLRARRPVSVRGVGRSLSGTYYVERVLHAFTGEGYTQRFTLRRNALGLAGREDFSESDVVAS
jgi:phage protein D